MKLFAKLLIAALVLAVLLPFTLLKGKDGRPLMSFDSLKAPDISVPELPDSVKMPELESQPGGKDIVYQWRDENGMLHFTSDPPPAGMKYTVKGYDPNANLIQSIEPEPEVVADTSSAGPDQNQISLDVGNPYSPENVKKLVDDAKQIQKILNDRYKQQEAIMGQ